MHRTSSLIKNNNTKDSQLMDLTDRENVILLQLAKGYANKEIAINLAISVPTVRTHLRRIYEKIGVRSRTEAVVKFFQRELSCFQSETITSSQN
jgi:DNA-binding CsgD family transcriptional regulator